MRIELTIENEDLQLGIKNGAEAAKMSIEDFTAQILEYSFNTSISTMAVDRLASILDGEFMERLIQIQINSYATRHQITNLHADLLGENEDRALEIAAEANSLAENAIYCDDE